MIPSLVRLSSLAMVTRGLEQRDLDSTLAVRGLALLTGFVTNEIWIGPSLIVTGWTICCAQVSTTWTDAYTQPVTGWSLV